MISVCITNSIFQPYDEINCICVKTISVQEIEPMFALK